MSATPLGECPTAPLQELRPAQDGPLHDKQPIQAVSGAGTETSQPLSLLFHALQSALKPNSEHDTRQYCLPSGSKDGVDTERADTIPIPSATDPMTGLSLASFGDTPAARAGVDLNLVQANLDSLSLAGLGGGGQQSAGFGLGSLHSPAQQQTALSNLESLAQLQAIARQTAIPQYQVPSLASLLTPSDTALLASLMALQQRQYAQQLCNGELLLSSLRPGHAKAHPNSSAPSSLYKTELCRSWQETGSCRYGNKCQFAHGPNELRPIQRHPKYKTEICRTFAQTGTCPYGSRCRFIHYFHHRQAAATSTASLLGQAAGYGAPGVLGGFQPSPSSASSLESYLTYNGSSLLGSGTGNGVGTSPFEGGAPSLLPTTQVTGGLYMPPLPPPADANVSLLSGLPSLAPQVSAGAPSESHRLPVFKTFTEASERSGEDSAAPASNALGTRY